jgi:uncharacterized protein (TIGR02145 family)
MKKKLSVMTIGLFGLIGTTQAQKMKIWKNGAATEYDVSTQVDSVTFEGASIMTDSRDSKVYKTVVIGTQTWMAENLNYGTYLGGVASDSKYLNGAQKFCYANNVAFCDRDGGIYQWHTAMNLAKECSDGTKSCSAQINNGNHQGICPVGWHIPKKTEWEVLTNFLGGVGLAGKKMKLSSFGNGDNSSGFSAIGTDDKALFWEADEKDMTHGQSRRLNTSDAFFSDNQAKYSGLWVRCLKG